MKSDFSGFDPGKIRFQILVGSRSRKFPGSIPEKKRWSGPLFVRDLLLMRTSPNLGVFKWILECVLKSPPLPPKVGGEHFPCSPPLRGGALQIFELEKVTPHSPPLTPKVGGSTLKVGGSGGGANPKIFRAPCGGRDPK